MTVKELINILKQFPNEAVIHLNTGPFGKNIIEIYDEKDKENIGNI